MKRKIILFFTLAIALQGPLQAYPSFTYSFSLNTAFKRLSSCLYALKEQAYKNPVLTAYTLTGLCATLPFAFKWGWNWWYSPKNAGPKPEKPGSTEEDLESENIDNNTITIININPLQQYGSTCGYHTAKNNAHLLKAVQENPLTWIDENKEALENIQDSSFHKNENNNTNASTQQAINPNLQKVIDNQNKISFSRYASNSHVNQENKNTAQEKTPFKLALWKKIVLDERKNTSLKEYILAWIKEKFSTNLSESVLEEESSQGSLNAIIRSTFENFARDKAKQIIYHPTQAEHIINKQRIIEWLEQELTNRKIEQTNRPDDNNNIPEKIIDAKNLQNYIQSNESDPSLTITEDTIENALEQHYKKKNLSPRTEILEGNEILLLLRKSGYFTEQMVDDNVTPCDDIDQLPFVTPLIIDKLKQKNCFHAFAIGTMGETDPKEAGHWFTFFLQKKNHQIRGFTLDSWGNINRANDTRILKVIDNLGLKKS